MHATRLKSSGTFTCKTSEGCEHRVWQCAEICFQAFQRTEGTSTVHICDSASAQVRSEKTGMAGHIQHEEVWDRLWPAVCQPNSAVFGLFPIVMVAKPDMTWNRHWLHWRKSEECEMQTIQLTAWGSANLPRWSKMHRSRWRATWRPRIVSRVQQSIPLP